MYVVFDLETTGLDSNCCDIIEFSYIAFDEYTNQPVRSETLYYYYPNMRWSEEAYAIHQIPLEFLKTQADKFQENVIKMFAILNRGKVCGHNAAKFDCVFATNWLQRMGMPRLKYDRIEDTMTMFKSITKTSRISLAKLRERLGIDEDTVNVLRDVWYHNGEKTDDMSAHNAEWDVTATSLILMKGINNGFVSFLPTPKNDEVAPIDFEEADFSGDADFFTDIHTFYLDVNDGDAYAINLGKKEARRVSREDEVYIDAGKRGMLLPIEFHHVSAIANVEGSDNNNTYSAKYKDTLWIFVNNDSVPVISYGTADTKTLYEVPESFNFIAYFNREDGR